MQADCRTNVCFTRFHNRERMTQPDVIIVGGGVVGVACGRALASCGASVEILDDGTRPGAATAASAGLLAPIHEAKSEDPVLTLCLRGRDLYRDLVAELREETGIDVHLWTGGILHVAFTPADVERIRGAIAWHRQQGPSPTGWTPTTSIREPRGSRPRR